MAESRGERVGERLDNHADRLFNLAEELESLRDEDIQALQARVDEIEDQLGDLTELGQRVEQLENLVTNIDHRTDMLRLVEDTEQLNYEQRRGALLQHLIREAKREGAREHGPRASAKTSITRKEAEKVLHYPDIHRATLCDDMKAIVEDIGNEHVCWYEDGTLYLDLEAGEIVASTYANGEQGV